MSAYSSSYAMFVLLYPLYYLYLTNCNTLVRNNNLVSFFANRAFVVAGYEKKTKKKKRKNYPSPFPKYPPTPNNESGKPISPHASVRSNKKNYSEYAISISLPFDGSFLSPDRKTSSISRSLSTERTQARADTGSHEAERRPKYLSSLFSRCRDNLDSNLRHGHSTRDRAEPSQRRR